MRMSKIRDGPRETSNCGVVEYASSAISARYCQNRVEVENKRVHKGFDIGRHGLDAPVSAKQVCSFDYTAAAELSAASGAGASPRLVVLEDQEQ